MSLFAADALSGKHVLVTGATGGIGSETARTLAAMGAAVTITGRNEEKLNQLKTDILRSLPEAKLHGYAADLGDAQDRVRLVKAAEDFFGPVSMLVNNAGIYAFGTLEQLDQDQLERVMYINYTSTVLLTQLVYKGMKERREGAIVNVSSLSGLRGGYGHTAYAASKFALIAFTHSFALEAIAYNVRVNAVCPGYVDTEMGYDVVREYAGVYQVPFEQQLKKTRESIPSGRMTTPREVANAIAFLLSDASANIVGESLKISGGALLR